MGRTSTDVTLETSDIQIGAVEIKNGTDDTRATVSTVGATTQLHTGIFNADGEQINSFGSTQLNGTHYSPAHFTTTYTSTSTLTLGGAPTISDNSQIVGIQVTSISNITIQYIAGTDGVSFGVSGNVIAAYKAGVAYEIFASDDISYRVVLNLVPIAQDQDLNQQNVGVQNPEWAHYTSSEIIFAETNLAVNTYFEEVTAEAYRNGIFHVGGNTSGSGVVWKVYGALDESRTVPSAGGTPGSEWADISQELMSASSITTTTRQKAIIRDTAVMYPYYLFEYTIDNATNTPTLLQNKY